MSQKPGDRGALKPPVFLAKPGAGASPQDVGLDMTLRRVGFEGARESVAQPIHTSSFTGGPAGRREADGATLALARRDWILDVMERQRRLSSLANGLMRCEGLTGDDFRDHFYAPGRPCVIAGAIADWPALAKWTPDYLRKTVGTAPVEFQAGREGKGDFELAKDRHKQVRPFTLYMDLIEQNPGNDAYVTAYNSAANQAAFAPLMADIHPIPSLLGPGQGCSGSGRRGPSRRCIST